MKANFKTLYEELDDYKSERKTNTSQVSALKEELKKSIDEWQKKTDESVKSLFEKEHSSLEKKIKLIKRKRLKPNVYLMRKRKPSNNR